MEDIGIFILIMAGVASLMVVLFRLFSKDAEEKSGPLSRLTPIVRRYKSYVQGLEVVSETSSGVPNPQLTVTVKGPELLRPPLIMASGNWMVTDAIPLEITNFQALNRLIGREALGAELKADLEKISHNASRYRIYRDQINCQLSLSSASQTIRDVTNTAVRAAARLRDLRESCDLLLYALLQRCGQSRDLRQRKMNLRLLLKHYNREEPLVAAQLEPLLASTDFELAFLAAAGLGKSMTEFMFDQAEHATPSSRIAAVREICSRRLDGAFDFLTRLYHTTNQNELRIEILHGCRRLEEERVSAFLAAELENSDDALLAAAVYSLEERGRRDALASLYALSADSARPEHLRQAAGAAIAAILKRVGKVDEGMLSTVDEADSGGLSLSEND
jgi:hypothetical protein